MFSKCYFLKSIFTKWTGEVVFGKRVFLMNSGQAAVAEVAPVSPLMDFPGAPICKQAAD